MKLHIQLSKKHLTSGRYPGFTIMEIVVATTIFAVAMSSMMALFNYTLKINRRTEALRQASQSMRNFAEQIVKEVRNGQIDYSVDATDHTTVVAPVGPCPLPNGNSIGAASDGSDSYSISSVSGKTNTLGIITSKFERLCFFLADTNGTYAGSNRYTGNASSGNPIDKLMVQKGSLPAESLNPQNFSVQELVFFVQPRRDPYVCTGGSARVQPFVVISMKTQVRLITGEQVTMYYQTSVSTNKYDVPVC